MRKNLKKYIVAVLMLITILPLALAGCDFTKKAQENSNFPLEEELKNFGSEYKIVSNIDATQTNKIKEGDNPVDAYNAIQDNFARVYDYIASRGIVSGTATNKLMTIDQRVYSTMVKERKNHKADTYTVFHEDAAIASQTINPSIVKVLQETVDGASTYKTKKILPEKGVNNNITNKELGYPKEGPTPKRETANYPDKTSYLAVYEQDIDKLLPYTIDGTTVDMANSSVKTNAESADILDINLAFVTETLQDATLERRKVIKVKTLDSPIEVTEDDVTFTNLSITIQVVKKTGYIRYINIKEGYTMDAEVVGQPTTQTCEFNSDYYFTHKVSELPIGLYTTEFNDMQ